MSFEVGRNSVENNSSIIITLSLKKKNPLTLINASKNYLNNPLIKTLRIII